MINFISKFLFVSQGKYKSLVFMLFLFLLTSFLEVVGIGMIGPFISLATNPGSIHENTFLEKIYTGLSLSSSYEFISLAGLFLIIIFYVKAFITFSAQKYVFEFGFKLQAELSCRLMKAYLTAPYTFHINRNTANVTQNIVKETERFANGLTMPLLTFFSNSILTLALLGLLVSTNILALVIISGVLVLAFVIVFFLKNRLKQWGKDGSDAGAGIIQAINHGLGGLKETKIIGCESYFEKELEEQANKFGKSMALAVSFTNLPRYTIEAFLITFLIVFTVLFLYFDQGSSQQLTSVLGIFAIASIRLLPAMSAMTSSVNGIRYSAYSLDKLYSDLKDLDEVAKNNQKREGSFEKLEILLPFQNSFSLNQVFYQYPNAKKSALNGISLTIPKGQSIGLIGKSGAGKTTLVDVILGLLLPQKGDITVDGVSIYGNLRSWQNLVGYVPQSIFLVDGSLKQNIAFGVPESQIDHKRLVKALKLAQLSELVAQLPQGLDTKVGERGVLLSGGQRQRVGIARALYHEREILVLDEATAALDNETESLVSDSIRSLMGSKTLIIIAHRLTTLENCDLIYELKDGKVLRSGTYQEIVLGEKASSV